MRRPGLVVVALAVSIAIVFTPHPLSSDARIPRDVNRSLLVGRILAPSIDVVEVRGQDAVRVIRDSAPRLWLVALMIGAILSLCAGFTFALKAGALFDRVLLFRSRFGRAPPPALV